MAPDALRMAEPALYGIVQSNRGASDLWGKNQFNSTFPTALACYMRDRDLRPVYLTVDKQLNVVATEISVAELFNSDAPNECLRFDFETKYDPYQRYALNDIGGIDLVVKEPRASGTASWRRPLEVKLTVLPDDLTSSCDEEDWGSELVIRPASTKYCALGILDSCFSQRNDVREIFEEVCGGFQQWNSAHEVSAKRSLLLTALNTFQRTFCEKQQPFLMQPIWKTRGKSPVLSDQAFDIFVWSDFALCRTFLDRSQDGRTEEVTRFMRSSARLARVLYVLSATGKANIDQIYTEMAFNLQTDKEFALAGKITRKYMPKERRATPAVSREAIVDIIKNGGQRMLSPERRFDASVYFTAEEMFELNAQKALAQEATAEAAAALQADDPAELAARATEILEKKLNE